LIFISVTFGYSKNKLPIVASRQYLRRVLKLSPANQGLILDVIVQIPWSLKLIYAFVSDTFPINGQRRKPYLFMGIISCALSWMMLGGECSLIRYSSDIHPMLLILLTDDTYFCYQYRLRLNRSSTAANDEPDLLVRNVRLIRYYSST
jgi:hypothetical protein